MRPIAGVLVGADVVVAALATGCGVSPTSRVGEVPAAMRGDGPAESVGEFVITFVFEPALAAPSRFAVVHESGLLRECGSGRTGCEVRLPSGPATLCYEVNGAPAEFVFVARESGEFVIQAPSPGQSGCGEVRR